jgi:hypothetical protein
MGVKKETGFKLRHGQSTLSEYGYQIQTKYCIQRSFHNIDIIIIIIIIIIISCESARWN